MKTTLRKSADPLGARADLLVVAVGDPPSPLPGPADGVDAALGGLIARSIEDGEVKGTAGALAVFHASDGLAARRVAVVGIGGGEVADWREAGKAAAGRAGSLRARKVALVPPPGAGADVVGAFVEGFGAGAYRFDRFKTKEDESGAPVERLAVHAPALRGADLRRAERVVAAVAAARDHANTPASHMTPSVLADRARALADETPGLSCEVLERPDLEALGAGALLAVARGSEEPPAMIVLRYRPKRRGRGGEVLGLVGKAVTFDTGGISIKPSSGMEEMKMDMAGGAAVMGAMLAVGKLKPKVAVTGLICSAENMPGGSALHPGDVITMKGGKTVEIGNTDAEGRLVMADGIVHAVQGKADVVVDIATLTGAAMVALGERIFAVMGNDQDEIDGMLESAERAGEKAWQLPLPDEYRKKIDSDIADLRNIGDRYGGAISAGLFLKEFAGDTPWLHLDIAGPARSLVDEFDTQKGASGAGVRTLVSWIESL
jgi:leucyl aminopeptidase